MTKHIIMGLLEIRNRRGLQGNQAHAAWVEASLEVLLRAELERIEQRERGA
jgi:hypothetical protein